VDADEIVAFIGSKMLERREQLGLSSAAVAARMESTRPKYARLEDGTEDITVDQLSDAAAALDLEQDDLLALGS
jgi:transcriptional regulator with XRE-family HTH domain